MTLTEMANFCNMCAYSPALCGGDPEICVTRYSASIQFVVESKPEEGMK